MLGGDIILAVNGIKLSEPDGRMKIKSALSRLDKGQEFTVTVLRGGRQTDLLAAPFEE